MPIDRSKMRSSLSGRADESAKRAESSGTYHPYILNTVPIPVYKKIPEGPIVFDIIPFKISHDFLINPDTHRPAYKAGDYHYNLDLMVHNNVGPNNWNVLCPRYHYGEPCVICDEANKRKEQVEFGDKEAFKKIVKPFLPNHRNVYQIWIHDKAKVEEAKGTQILEISFFSLEEKLLAIRKNPETGETIEFAWPGIDGKRITFTRKGTGMTNTQYLGYSFLDRKEEIPDSILDQAVPLNEFIEVLTAKKVEELFMASKKDEDENSDDSDDSDQKEEQQERTERKPRGLSRKPKEEAPADPPRRERRERRERTNACPYGHAFGVDTDTMDECSKECPDKTYNACSAMRDSDDAPY